MENIELTSLIIPFIAGAALCLIHMVLIKLTLKKLQETVSPMRTLALGAFIRLVIAGLTFYYFASNGKHWSEVVACLVGYVIIRMVVLSRIIKSVDIDADNKTENNKGLEIS